MKTDDLNTGTLPIFDNEEPNKVTEEIIGQQEQIIRELMPGVEWLQQQLNDAVADVCDMRSYMDEIGNKPDGDDIEAEYAGRARFIILVERLKFELNSKVGEAKHAAGQ